MQRPTIQSIRSFLNLDERVWNYVPDQWILQAFNRYDPFADTLEFLGDKLAALIVTQYFDSQNWVTSVAPFLTNAKFNDVFRDICELAYERRFSVKACADAFESLLGFLFYYLNDILDDPDAYSHVRDWMISNFPTWDTQPKHTGKWGCKKRRLRNARLGRAVFDVIATNTTINEREDTTPHALTQILRALHSEYIYVYRSKSLPYTALEHPWALIGTTFRPHPDDLRVVEEWFDRVFDLKGMIASVGEGSSGVLTWTPPPAGYLSEEEVRQIYEGDVLEL